MRKASEEEQEHVERGWSEEASGSPLTPAEEESSVRPPGATPGVTPEAKPDYISDVDDTRRERLKEMNPDDFE